MTTSTSVHECPEEWLAAALAGDLSAQETRALDEHLADCENCRALQTDFAAIDELLLRDFPPAVGPSGGFEARLVADFRRRHARGGKFAKLRALVSWLLRQRGVQVAGVAAALVAMIGLGQQLTGRTRQAQSVLNDARIGDGAIDQFAVENGIRSDQRVNPAILKDLFHRQQPHSLAAANPAVNNGTPVPMLGDVPLTGRLFRPDSRSVASDGFGLALDNANTFTGTPVIASAGTVSVTGTATGNLASSGTSNISLNGRLPNLALLNGRKVTDSTENFYGRFGFAEKGDIQDQRYSGVVGFGDTSNQNLGFTPATSTTPTPGASTAPGAVPSADSTPAPPDVRKLIRNARAELEVTAFDTAIDAITTAATSSGGFLDTRNSTRGGNGKISGTIVVKVLPENLDRFLAGLRTLGDVKNQTIRTEDVTKDYFDTDARLRNARRMEDRLLKMLDEVKGKMSEVLQVEKELGRVRADIETMQGQLKLYDAQVRYATVTLDVHEKDLGRPVSFLLNETATLSVLCADVERAAAEAHRIADAAHAQVVRSEISRDASGRARATMRWLIAPETAAEVIAQVKGLGRVENFNLHDERTAQNGNSSETNGEDSARVERGPVAFDITISHDEQVSRQVSFSLVAPDVEGAFEKARDAAVAAGGEIVNAYVTHPQNGHASATLGVRVPAAAEAGWTATLKTLGRAGNVETRRIDNGPSAGQGPVFVSVNIVDQEPAAQQTAVRVQTNDVERRADEIKREAAASHVTVEASSFASEGNGRQRAGLKFRLPMKNYAAFIERLRALGAVKDFTVQREDRLETPSAGEEASAPAVIDLTLYNEGSVVSENAGLGATLRRTLGQGTGALTWSVQMIGVAAAFLAPWAVLLAVAVWTVRWFRRRAARRRSGQAP